MYRWVPAYKQRNLLPSIIFWTARLANVGERQRRSHPESTVNLFAAVISVQTDHFAKWSERFSFAPPLVKFFSRPHLLKVEDRF